MPGSLGTSQEKLHEAVYTRLRDDATLLALTGADPDAGTKARVYDEPPDNAAMPYIVVDVPTGTPFNTFSKTGRVWLVDVHVHSSYRGSQEVQQIAARVDALLADCEQANHAAGALTVTGHTVADFAFDDLNMLRHSPILREAVLRYRVTLQES
jgi:hypothetical protein